MRLVPAQLEQLEREGYLFFPGLFSAPEIKVLTDEVPALYAQRRPENVREKTGDVVRMIAGEGLRVILVGTVVGVAGALALTRVLESLLFGVSAADPPTFIAVAALVVAAGLAACYVPARRAARVDPVAALREP